MNPHQFPALSYFFGAYCHQDWDLDSQNILDIIHCYLTRESVIQVQKTIQEIENLIALELSPSVLKEVIESNFNCYYDPTIYGITYDSWLLWVQMSLKQGIFTKVPAIL